MQPELIAVLVLAVGIPAVIVAGVALHRHQVGTRLEAAERLGLAYVRDRQGAERGRVLGGIRVWGSDRLVGTWRGRRACVDFARQSHGGHGATNYTRAVLEGGAPAGLKLLVRRESLGSRLGEAMGLVRELKTGDEALDRTWRVEGSPESAVLSMMRHPAVRAGLQRDPGATAALARDGRLELLVRGTARDAERVRTILDLASDLADAVSRP